MSSYLDIITLFHQCVMTSHWKSSRNHIKMSISRLHTKNLVCLKLQSRNLIYIEVLNLIICDHKFVKPYQNGFLNNWWTKNFEIRCQTQLLSIVNDLRNKIVLSPFVHQNTSVIITEGRSGTSQYYRSINKLQIYNNEKKQVGFSYLYFIAKKYNDSFLKYGHTHSVRCKDIIDYFSHGIADNIYIYQSMLFHIRS